MRIASIVVGLVSILVGMSAFAVENKWRLEFSGNAEAPGTLVIAITPAKGEPVKVDIGIARRLSENRVARTVARVLRDALGDGYHVERDDGEDVLIKRRLGTDKFEVTIVSNTVPGVRVNVDPE